MLKSLLQRFLPRTLRWFPHHPDKCEVVGITIRFRPMNPDGTYGATSTSSWDQWAEALRSDFVRWIKFWRRWVYEAQGPAQDRRCYRQA